MLKMLLTPSCNRVLMHVKVDINYLMTVMLCCFRSYEARLNLHLTAKRCRAWRLVRLKPFLLRLHVLPMSTWVFHSFLPQSEVSQNVPQAEKPDSRQLQCPCSHTQTVRWMGNKAMAVVNSIIAEYHCYQDNSLRGCS